MLVPIANIRAIPEAQPRVALDTTTVESYAEALRGGAEFPPVIAFFDGAVYWLADGFHRLAAYRAIDAVQVPLDKRTGGRRDAMLYAVGANAEHGLPRTNADKRRAVEILLADEEWGKKSDRWIAEKACVDHKTVSRLRTESTGEVPQLAGPRQGRDGKARALPAKKVQADAGLPSETSERPAPPPSVEPKTESEPQSLDGYSTEDAAEWARVKLAQLRAGKGKLSKEDWSRFVDECTKVLGT